MNEFLVFMFRAKKKKVYHMIDLHSKIERNKRAVQNV